MKSSINWTNLDPINPTSCIDSNGERPTGYTFYCRSWFLDFLESKKFNPGHKLSMSKPYEVIDQYNKLQQIITFCLSINDDTEDIVLVCIDYNISIKWILFSFISFK